MKTAEEQFTDACIKVAKKYNLGDNLITGHRRTYFEEAAILMCLQKTTYLEDRNKELSEQLKNVEANFEQWKADYNTLQSKLNATSDGMNKIYEIIGNYEYDQEMEPMAALKQIRDLVVQL